MRIRLMRCDGRYVSQGWWLVLYFFVLDKQGTIAFSGYATETVEEDSERYGMFKLIGRPASPKVGRPKKG